MAYSVGGVSFDLKVNLKTFEKQLDKAFGIAKKKGAGLVWDTSSFVAGLKMTKKEFKSFSNEVSKARDKYEELLDLQKGLQSSEVWGKLGDQARNAVTDAVSSAKEEAQIYDRTLKHMGRAQRLKSIFGGLGKVFGGFFSIFRRQTAKAGAEFGGFLKKLIGIAGVAALLRKAFSYAREGMENLVKADANTANSVATLKNALTALKNALASAFAPILNTIAPILAKFIGMLVTAANAVASFISALLGKKFVVVANGVADGISGIGDSASGANDSAKELQRTLMGFDKINKLDSTSGGGGGGSGGSGGTGSGGGFDLVPVGDEANKWADKFRESWENADFYWLGELLANKLNDALEKIPWDKIQDAARRLAKSLATFLNGFIENADWNLVGETIAQALNTAVYFAQEFVHTFNWSALGKAVADTINGFFKKTDWSAIGDTIGTALVGALTSLNETIKDIDWEQVGASIVEMISSIDWVGIFKNSVELIGNIAGAIFDLFKGAITKAKDELAEWVKTGKIWDDLFTMGEATVKVSLVKNGWTSISAFVGTIVSVGVSLVKSGWTALSSFVGTAVSVATKLTKDGWKSIAGFVGSSLSVSVKLVKDGWKSIAGFVGSTVKVSVKLVKSGWKSLSSWVGNLIKVGVKLFKKAAGGLYKNGKWSPIQRYAEGGLPNGSQLFWAREKGPELVGTLGGHTAVMNNDQIVASVSSGVAKAIAGIRFKMSAPPLAVTGSNASSTHGTDDDPTSRQMITLLTQILEAINAQDTDVYLDGEMIKNNVVRRINNHTRATGQLELII